MNINRFFNFETKTIKGSVIILSIFSFLSRLLGLIREGLLMAKFGASSDLDIYFTAFRIPDLVYNILIAGGIVVAFLPLFSKYFSKDPKKAWQFATNLLNIFLFFLVLITLFLYIFTPQLLKIIAPGFSFEAQKKCILLTRLMLLSPILFGLSSIFSGILHYFNRFLIYGFCPILYNLGIILGILFLAPYFGILGVAIGVILGAFLYFAIQFFSAINCGFKYSPVFSPRDSRTKRVFKLMIPRTFGMMVHQINLIVITAIASTLTTGSIAVFNFANNIRYLPIGIIGISFAIAIFPALSRTWAKDQREEFRKTFFSAFGQIFSLIIPISFLIFIFRTPIIDIISKIGYFILGTSQFSGSAIRLTAASLGLFSLGLIFSTLIPLLLRGFFALEDTKTPTLIAFLTVVLNIILSLVFVSLLAKDGLFQAIFRDFFNLEEIKEIQVLGLPLAFSLSSIFQFTLLYIFLHKKLTPTRSV